MEIRRHILGLFGLVFLLIGFSLVIAKGTNDAQWSMLASVCIRVGLMIGAIWLAFPQILGLTQRFPPWLLATIGFSGLVIAARPRMAIYLGPVVAVIAFLQFVGWLFKPLPKQPSRKKTLSKKTLPKKTLSKKTP